MKWSDLWRIPQDRRPKTTREGSRTPKGKK